MLWHSASTCKREHNLHDATHTLTLSTFMLLDTAMTALSLLTCRQRESEHLGCAEHL